MHTIPNIYAEFTTIFFIAIIEEKIYQSAHVGNIKDDGGNLRPVLYSRHDMKSIVYN